MGRILKMRETPSLRGGAAEAAIHNYLWIASLTLAMTMEHDARLPLTLEHAVFRGKHIVSVPSPRFIGEKDRMRGLES